MITASTMLEVADVVDMRFKSTLFRKCDLAVGLTGDQVRSFEEVAVLGVCGLCFGSLPRGLRDEEFPFMIGATSVLTGLGG